MGRWIGRSEPRPERSAPAAGITVRQLVVAALLAALTAVLAYVRIPLPFSPVPVSGQTLGVMLSGSLLGPRTAALSQMIYVLMGLVGLPVFAGGTGGWSVIVGPTGGYLIGFMVGAYVTGLIASRGRGQKGFWHLTLAHGLGGVVAVYAVGVVHLAWVADLPLRQAAAVGALPFLPGDIVKVLLATAVVRALSPTGGPLRS